MYIIGLIAWLIAASCIAAIGLKAWARNGGVYFAAFKELSLVEKNMARISAICFFIGVILFIVGIMAEKIR